MRAWDRLDHAAECFRNTLRFKPDHILALIDLGEALLAAGRYAESEQYCRKAISLAPGSDSAYSNLLVAMNYNPEHRPRTIFEEHRRWGDLVRRRLRRPPSPLPLSGNADPERRLRIGYVSSDFCRHPAAAFLEPLLRYRSREGFELFCYSQGKVRDEKTAEFERLADSWREIRGSNDDRVEEMIRTDAIDLLVDCTGHMADNRLPLFGRRIAPVQVSWIGYPNTTGLETVDFRFTDAIADPPGEVPFFTEKPVRLPAGFCCFTPPETAIPVMPLPALSKGIITFGSLHTPARLNPEVIALWSRVLITVPESRLLIFRSTVNEEIRARLTAGFAANGVPAARLAFDNILPAKGHLAVYHGVDIALDTFPWSGHTTACEALWMGVPVITLQGERHAGRMTASVLHRLGLDRLVARTADEFVVIAEREAAGLAALVTLRAGLRERMRSSPLCDGAAFVAAVERAYRECWREKCGMRMKETPVATT